MHVVLPQRSGVVALTEVLEPFIVLSAIVATPFALLGRRRVGVAAVGLLVVAVIARYGPGFIGGAAGGESQLTVTAWNVEAGENAGARIVDGVSGVDSDLVALEELQPAMASAISSDPALSSRYPYRALAPDATVLGVGLLSRYPILEQTFSLSQPPRDSAQPPFMRALVAIPPGPTVVFVVHPLPGRFETVLGLPVALNTDARDAAIATIRAAVDVDLAAGRPVLVLGDINTTEREPAYRDLSSGLLDARRVAGSWPGLSWRPDTLAALPFGLLRIDYLFSSPTLTPIDYSVRCTQLSDHCLVSAAYR